MIEEEFNERDTTKNSPHLQKYIDEHDKLEKGLVPLRLNATTVIMVKPKKRNESYKLKAIEKFGL